VNALGTCVWVRTLSLPPPPENAASPLPHNSRPFRRVVPFYGHPGQLCVLPPSDIAPEFAGIIMALTNSAATLCGIVAPYVYTPLAQPV
jgi:hypothetical protein